MEQLELLVDDVRKLALQKLEDAILTLREACKKADGNIVDVNLTFISDREVDPWDEQEWEYTFDDLSLGEWWMPSTC